MRTWSIEEQAQMSKLLSAEVITSAGAHPCQEYDMTSKQLTVFLRSSPLICILGKASSNVQLKVTHFKSGAQVAEHLKSLSLLIFLLFFQKGELFTTEET